MSKYTVCDIKDCDGTATEKKVIISNIEIVPTGNSDYSAYEEATLISTTIDICEKHFEEYEKKLSNILIKDSKGLRFKGSADTLRGKDE